MIQTVNRNNVTNALLLTTAFLAITTVVSTILQSTGHLFKFSSDLGTAANYIWSTGVPIAFTFLTGTYSLYRIVSQTLGSLPSQDSVKESIALDRRHTSSLHSTDSSFDDEELTTEYSSTTNPLEWKPSEESHEDAIDTMWETGRDVIMQKAGCPGYISEEQIAKALPHPTSLQNPRRFPEPLSYQYADVAKQGLRPTMDDEHFYTTIEQGTLMGVFDGHNGSGAAGVANHMFQDNFSTYLKEYRGNVRNAFEALFYDINEKITDFGFLQHEGATAVVSFIDKKTDMVYTATLGDCEANIYRKIDGELVSIPLSCTLDWSDPQEAERAAIRLGDKSIATEWPESTKGPKGRDSKMIRYPDGKGINISRSFGDDAINKKGLNHDTHPGRVVSCKPEITVNRLQKGDVLLLCCDGIKDYLKEVTIIDHIDQTADESFEDCLEDIADAALRNMEKVTENISDKGNDNVTLIGLKF